MKIIIHYDEAELHIDTTAPPEQALGELLDTFSPRQVPTVINEVLRTFQAARDGWNERELAERRASQETPASEEQ